MDMDTVTSSKRKGARIALAKAARAQAIMAAFRSTNIKQIDYDTDIARID